MKRLATALLVLTLALPVLAGDSPPRNEVPGLKLPAPAKVKAGAGYRKLVIDTKATSVAVDVEAEWDSEDAEFSWELLPGNVVLVAIPASAGLIRVSAVGLVDGKLTGYARTTVEVQGTPKPAPPVPAPPAPGPAPAPTSKVAHAYFVIDPAGDANITALVTSAGLRNALRAAGVAPHAYRQGSPAAAGLAKEVAGAGGAPALVLKTATGELVAALRCPATQDGVLAAIRGGR